MNIDPTYQSYYVYTSLLHHDKEISSGACPLVWVDSPVPGKSDLTWTYGNYHLYLSRGSTDCNLKIPEHV